MTNFQLCPRFWWDNVPNPSPPYRQAVLLMPQLERRILRVAHERFVAKPFEMPVLLLYSSKEKEWGMALGVISSHLLSSAFHHGFHFKWKHPLPSPGANFLSFLQLDVRGVMCGSIFSLTSLPWSGSEPVTVCRIGAAPPYSCHHPSTSTFPQSQLVTWDWCHLSQRCQTIPLQASTCWDWKLRKLCPLGSLSAGAASERWIARGPRGPGAAPGAHHPLLLQEPQLQALAEVIGMAGLAGRRDFVRSIKGGQNGAHFQVCLMVW